MSKTMKTLLSLSKEPLLDHQDDIELNSVPVGSDSSEQQEPLLSRDMEDDCIPLTPVDSPQPPKHNDAGDTCNSVSSSPRASGDAETLPISEDSDANRKGASTPNDEKDHSQKELHQAAGKGDLLYVKEVFDRLRADINVADTQGYHPLYHAAKSGKRDIIEFLLQNGATVNTKRFDDGLTPLHAAIISNTIDAVKCLIENGADVVGRDNNGFTCLHFAATNGFHEILKYILNIKGVDGIVNATDNTKKTPLHHAISCGSLEATQLLLHKSADMRATDSGNNTVLHIAAAENCPDLIELIIGKDSVVLADGDKENFVNQQNAHQCTALEVASLRGNIEAANVLIGIEKVKTVFTNEVDNKTIDMKVMYPLHRASANGEQSVIQYFIEKKVPIDIKDLNGFTPLMVAVSNGQENVVNYLIANGANIQLRDFHLKTCLHIAVEKRQTSILRLLLRQCKEYLINDRDMEYMTPLHYAAKYGNAEALTVLLERASFIEVDHKGKSPLHCAAESGGLECVRLLTEAQLDINLQANDGETSAPICFAAKKGHTEVCKYLIENGAKIKNLSSAKTSIFVNTFEKLIESTTINPEEDWEELARPRFSSVRREVACLKELLALDRKGKPKDHWIYRTINGLKEEICAVFDEYQQKDERQNKVVQMLQEDIKTKFGESEKVIMGKLIEEAPGIAEYALDKSIQSFEGTTRKRYHFGLLDIHHTDADIDEPFFGPDTMNRCFRRQLLEHPVTLRLMKIKWTHLGLVSYLLNCLLYIIFLALLTTMIVVDKKREHNRTSSTANATLLNPPGKALPSFTFMLCIFGIIKEFVRIYFVKTLIFRQVGTLTELVTYIASILFMTPFLMGHTDFMQDTLKWLQEFKWQSGAIAILCAWVTFLLYLKKIPAVGRYVWMFEEVVKTVLRVVIGLIFLLIAFAFSFYVLLKSQTQFNTYPRSLMKTVMWTFGEFEYDNIFVESSLNHKELTLIIFMVFLIIMPILTMNLLVGLAVGDIEEVRQTAFERNFENQVNILDAFNETYPRWLLRRLYTPYVDDDPNTSTLTEIFVEWFIDLEKDDKPDEQEMQVITMQNIIAKELMEKEEKTPVNNGHTVSV